MEQLKSKENEMPQAAEDDADDADDADDPDDA